MSTVVRGADLAVVPWRNGGGHTREVAAQPPGTAEFDWRVSLADVQTSGPFSVFDGVDRTIVLLDGPGMRIEVAGTAHHLRRYVPFSFDGGVPTAGSVPDGPTRDLNVMTRRGSARAEVEVQDTTTPASIRAGGTLLVLCLAGAVEVRRAGGEPVRLGREDTWLDVDTAGADVSGGGTAAVVRITSTG